MLHLIATPIAALLLLTCLFGGVACGWSTGRRLSPREWLGVAWMLGIFIIALWVRHYLLVPHHMMYLDEPWYMEAARNLLHRHAPVLCEETGSGLDCQPYRKAVGWPVLLAGVFSMTSASDAAAFLTSALLGALCAPLVAAITLSIGGRWHHALLAATVMAVHPLHSLWSATAETNAPATAILLAGLLGAVLFLRTPAWSTAILAAGGLGFATAMRPELAVASLPALICLNVMGIGTLLQRVFIAFAAGLGALSIPLTWGFYESSSDGAFLRAANISENISRIILDPAAGGMTLVILLLAGTGAMIGSRRKWFPATLILFATGVLIGGWVLTFDSRIFYTRNFLGATVCLIPIAAVAIPDRWMAMSLVAGLAAIGVAHLTWPVTSNVPETQSLENELPTRVAALELPKNALVLAEFPTIVRAVGEIPTMATRRAIGQIDDLLSVRPIYLFCDMFCEPGFQGGRGAPACLEVLARFALSEETTVSLHSRRYGLYRMRKRQEGEMPSPPPCPFNGPSSPG